MRGILLHYNYESHQGLIRAEDGKRYAFQGQEWRSEKRPSVGDDIDFEVQGSVAYDIYLLKSAAAQVDLTRVRDSVTQGARSVSQGARELSGTAWGQRVLGNWTAIIALVTLLGCFLPYITVGAQSSSLFGAGSGIGTAIDSIAHGENIGRMFAPTNRLQRQQAPPDLSGLKWSLRIGYLLYLVPLLSVLVIARELLNRPTRSSAFWQALVSMVVPIAVPLAMSAAMYAQIPRELSQLLQMQFDISFLNIGFWVMVLGGLAQLLNWMGLLKRRPRDLVGARQPAENR